VVIQSRFDSARLQQTQTATGDQAITVADARNGTPSNRTATSASARSSFTPASGTPPRSVLLGPDLFAALRTSDVRAYREISATDLEGYTDEELLNLRARLDLPALPPPSSGSTSPATGRNPLVVETPTTPAVGSSSGSRLNTNPVTDDELAQMRAEQRSYDYALERYEAQVQRHRPGQGPAPVPPKKSAFLLDVQDRLNRQLTADQIVNPPVVDGEVVQGDPLQQSEARGGVFTDVQERFYEDQIEQALGAGVDIPGSVQAGPTCGLQLLVSIFDGLQAKEPSNGALKNPLVRPEDADRPESHEEDITRDTNETLLKYALDKGYTTQGEIFTATDMAEIARHFGYKANVKTSATLADVKALIARGNVPLMAIDVDRVGNPGLFEGARAHWVSIEGTFVENGVEYVVGTHTWDGGEYVWPANQVFQSTNQLKFADKSLFPKSPDDLTKTLAGRVIEISTGN
jgi:hypothetical protein